MVAVKGIEVLIHALKKIHQDDIKLLIVGDYNNEYGNKLKTDYEGEAIKFFGKQSDVRPYLSLSDVFVIPTKNEGRREGLPIALLEAMAQGRIAIGSNISGIKDVLDPFQEQLFEAGNVDDLKLKLEKVIQLNENERLELEEKMTAHTQKHYNIPDFVLQHENLYKKLMR